MKVKKFLLLIMTMAMLLACLPVTAFAEELETEAVEVIHNTRSVNQEVEYVTEENAVVQLRELLKQRSTEISLFVQTSESEVGSIWHDVYCQAIAHTGISTEGDYIRYHTSQVNGFVDYSVDNGICYAMLRYEVTYHSTIEQEQELDSALAVVLEGLNIFDETDYRKVEAIYDYITSNVVYDYENKTNPDYSTKLTAYAALIDKTCVCQGYANLFYRMALTVGVDCRIVSGTGQGESHAWNIVCINGRYYNIDCTWDAEQIQAGYEYAYFLKCDANFGDHIRDSEYLATDFCNAYPIADCDFVPVTLENQCEGDYIYSVTEGEATITQYTGTSKNLVIPSTLGGFSVRCLAVDSFREKESLVTVTIPASVTSFGDGWCESHPYDTHGVFTKCTNLTTVYFETGSGLTEISPFAFAQCEKLSEVVLPGSIRCLERACFIRCSGLTEINLPEGLETIGPSAFNETGLKTIHIPASCVNVNWGAAWDNLEEFTVEEGNPRYRVHEGVLYDNMPPTGAYTGWTMMAYPKNKPGSSYRVADFCTHIFGDIFAGQDYQPRYLETIYIGDCDAAVAPDGGISLSRIRFKVVPDDTNPYFVSYNEMLFTKDMKTLIQVPSYLTGTVVIPEGVEKVENYAAEFGNYTTLILPETVVTLGGAALWQTSTVKTIYIPGSIQNVTGSSVFMDCYNMEAVYFGGTEEQWNEVFYPQDVVFGPMYLAGDFEIHLNSRFTITAPTCTGEGTAVLCCGECDKSNTESIAALDHDYGSDGVCKVCGDARLKKVRAFARRLYTCLLNREAEVEGLEWWTEQLKEEKYTAAQAAASFIFGQEFVEQNNSNEVFLDRLYATFFDREPDEGGKTYWLNYLENGVTREYVTAQFVNSAEFEAVCAEYGMQRGSIGLSGYVNLNPNLTMYVVRCYREIHGREADPSGLEYWCEMIATKQRDATLVAKSFIDSEEFIEKNLSNEEYIKVLYRAFMGRESDPSGLAYWVGRLEAGTPRLVALDEFANCQEFWDILASFGL